MERIMQRRRRFGLCLASAFWLALSLANAAIAADERKQFAFDVVDRNAQAMTERAHAEFEADSKKTPYFSLVPSDAKPDTALNRAEMEKYRPEMRKFYLNKAPRFN
jgi:hypothetical protein